MCLSEYKTDDGLSNFRTAQINNLELQFLYRTAH